MKEKYIIISQHGAEVPILFCSFINHDVFLRCWCKSLILSAGFFELYSDQDNHDKHYVQVWGQSISLGIRSRIEDKEIIEKLLN